MVHAAGLLAVSILIAWLECPKLLKRKMTRELWAFSLLLLLGTAVGIAHALRMKLPNPLDLITFLYKPVSDVVYHLLT
jgi:hypothetical protein